MSNQTLSGRVALVTGVSRRKGIGFAISKRLLSMGANLCIQSFAAYDATQSWGADNETKSVSSELNHDSKIVRQIEIDLVEPDAPAALMNAAIEAFGHIDILIVNHTHSEMVNLEFLTAEHIDKHLSVNVRASLLLIKEFARQHDGRPGGRILMLTSGQHLDPMPLEIAYAASKGAIREITKSLAAHLAPRMITVNAINPGATDTGYASASLYEEVISHAPMGRWGEPDDAARLIAWLATDDAKWITGQTINSTGGIN